MPKIWILCLLFLLSSCFKPHYTRPDIDVPDSWRISTDEGSTLCNMRWWEQFQDPALNELILTALQNNQDLQVAIHRVLEFYDRFGVTISEMSPTILGNGSYTRTESSNALPVPLPLGVNRINNDYLASFNLSWELDFWGRLRSATEASYADLLGEVQARRAVVITVVSSVADTYILLRQLDAQLAISRNTYQSRIQSLKLAQDRFHLGETSLLEVKQAESELETAAIAVLEFERDIPAIENQLSILLGENPHAIIRGRPIDAFQYPPSIPAGLPSDLLLRRPDIAEAEDNLIAANARVTQARALFFPQFSLTGLYGSESDKLHTFLTSPARFWQYGLSAVQTIFDSGRIAFLVEGAKEVREQALYTYQQTILNAFAEVDSALVTTQSNLKLVAEHQKQVHVLSDVLHLSQLRYEEGEVDYLNVLDAERSLFNAQLALAQSQADSFTAIVKLYSALGGGWVDDADSTALTDALCE